MWPMDPKGYTSLIKELSCVLVLKLRWLTSRYFPTSETKNIVYTSDHTEPLYQ